MDQPLHCYSCGAELVREHAHVCPLCGQSFCYEHQEPEAHNCIKLGTENWSVYRHQRELWRRKNPRVSLGDRKPIDYEQVRVSHEIRHQKLQNYEINQHELQKQERNLFLFIVIAVIIIIAIYLLMN